MDIYHKQPLFYKTMLQESRFNILLATLCFIFGQRIACVSDIKELCARYRIASPNRVIAILTLLRTTGRVQTRRDGDDRRRVILGPTEKGVEELKYYLRGTLEPLGLLFPKENISVNVMDKRRLRQSFFHNAADYLFNGVIYKKILPDACLFIEKDGGRMLMLYLYLLAREQCQENQVTVSCPLSQLAKIFFISRTHTRRILQAAEQAGYLAENEDGSLTLFPSFFELVENYAGFYFAYPLNYLGLSDI